MTSIRSSWILGLLIILCCQNTTAQNIDSLIQSRNQLLQDYTLFKENMGERTWLNLVKLSDLSHEIIELDNLIVDYSISQGIDQHNSIKARAEELNLEITLLKRESEIQKMVLDERKTMYTTLLFIIGGISVLLILMIIFASDRHVRFINTKMELERTWAGEIEVPKVSASEQEFRKVNQEIRSLSTENTKLKDQVLELMSKINEKEKILDEELVSRKQLKTDIRNLITQIKSQ